jgi:hypothetical protein
MKKFLYPPDQASYSLSDGKEVVATQLEGGASRYRRDIINASVFVDVVWTFSTYQYDYFRAFLKGSAADRGSKPFLIDLIIDEATQLTEHEAYFIPGSIRTASVRGLMVQVQASLEVKPIVYEDGYFDLVVALTEEFGDRLPQEVQSLFNNLHEFVNVKLPSLGVFDGD